MTFTITCAWWWIPTAITLAVLFWAVCIVDDGGGYLSGIGNVLAMVPALVVACIAWAVAGALK